MPRPGIVTLAILLEVIAATPGGQAPAEPVEAYAAAVRVYAATGEPASAVEGIRDWSLAQFGEAVREYAMRADAALDVAAVLQLEFGMLSVTAAPGLASQHLDLRELFVRVLEELRSRYLLTYYPTGVTREGWHDVTVTLKGARGDVIARPGYFVASK